MATLKIVAKADVASAKASLKTLTAEEANLLAKQASANLARRQDAERTAKEQMRQAKAAGNVSKQELADLRKLENIAVADAKRAVKDVKDAKAQASRASKEAISSELQAIKHDGKLSTQPGQRRAGDATDKYTDSIFNRALGPGALLGAVGGLITQIRAMNEEMKSLRLELAQSALGTGKDVGSFRKAAEVNDFSGDEAQAVVQHAMFKQSAVPTEEYLSAAREKLASSGNAKQVISETDKIFAEKAGELPEETVYRTQKRIERHGEVINRENALEDARRTNSELLEDQAYKKLLRSGKMSRYGRFNASLEETFTSDETILERGFSGPKQFRNSEYNNWADAYIPFPGEDKPRRIDVRVISDLTTQRPLGGE